MTMSVLIQKERSRRWLNLGVVVILIAIITIDLLAYFRPNTDSGRETARVAATINAWLRAQKTGGDCSRYWVSSEAVEPTRFHQIRSWKIVHIEPFDYALVQMESLSEAGELFSKLWKVHLGIDRHGARLITRVVDAADESAPPPILVERTESPLARSARREKTAAAEKLERVSQEVQELQGETKRDLGSLGLALDRDKEETDRRIVEQEASLQRMAVEIGQLQRELVAARTVAMLDGNLLPFPAAPAGGDPFELPGNPFAHAPNPFAHARNPFEP
jgi:hypothetical protein